MDQQTSVNLLFLPFVRIGFCVQRYGLQTTRLVKSMKRYVISPYAISNDRPNEPPVLLIKNVYSYSYAYSSRHELAHVRVHVYSLLDIAILKYTCTYLGSTRVRTLCTRTRVLE